jgi:DNA helicase HerA-like ATPase
MSEEIQIRDSVFRIGKVISVDGRSVDVSVDKSKNTSHLVFKGELIKNVSVGSYIKIVKGFTKIICKVDGEFIKEDYRFPEGDFHSERDRIKRTLKVSLLGFFDGDTFKRGIREMPLIDNECYILDRREFDAVHHFVGDKDKPLAIGTLSLEKAQPIAIGIDSLLASHIGIFGNTGSGKSYTLAKLYHELFELYKDKPKFIQNAHFFLIDFNGEYVDTDDDIIVEKRYKKTYKLSTNEGGSKFPIPSESLYDPEFWKVILQATDKTQGPFLKRALKNRFFADRVANNDTIQSEIGRLILKAVEKKDRELGLMFVFDMLHDVGSCFENSNIPEVAETIRGRLHYHNRDHTFYYDSGIYEDALRRLLTEDLNLIDLSDQHLDEIEKLRLRVTFMFYSDAIYGHGHANREFISPLIKRMEARISDVSKVIELSDEVAPTNFTIVSLKDVNIDMKKILPLLFCKLLYQAQKKRPGDSTYLNIIVDEAHNILSKDSFREHETWKDYRLETFEEIIKEGRKFGVFITLASQRPSDISNTIISQLHNYFLHRLINNNDILAVEKTISYLDKVSFEYLPILPTGTCIVAGLSAQVPVVVDIGLIPEKFEPKNKTRGLIKHWE